MSSYIVKIVSCKTMLIMILSLSLFLSPHPSLPPYTHTHTHTHTHTFIYLWIDFECFLCGTDITLVKTDKIWVLMEPGLLVRPYTKGLGIPWWSSAYESALSLLSTWIWSLVGELKIPQATGEKKNHQK